MISSELFERYFGYPNPSQMYQALNKTKNSEESKAQVNIIENRLANLIEVLKSSPTSNVKKIKNRNNLLEIDERILYFNQLNQLGKDLKILTPNQMLSRFPISLTQLKAGNNSEKLRIQANFVFFVQIKKSLQKMFIKVWLTLFKNGNNLYGHQKQEDK